MPTVVTSKHLQGATELTLIADIKSGFVPIPDPTSYASRLRSTLEFLFQARQGAVERDGLVGNAGPLEKLRSLHFVHWSIHDQDRKLLLAVSFDGPWEPYIRAIVDALKPKPVNVLMASDFATVADLAEIGVRRISVGGALARAAWSGFLEAGKEIADHGTFHTLARAVSGAEMNRLLN